MLFNSFTFLVFFSVVFLLYWFVFNRNLKAQNVFLLIASYIFYAFADWRFLTLLIATSALTFYLGKQMEDDPKYRRPYLFWGTFQGLGMLLFFKYFNFFISSFNHLFSSIFTRVDVRLLDILVPVGISFFTFRTLSYLQDVYKKKIRASRDPVNFFLYISFFPCLLAGPIDKAKTFMPQVENPRSFSYALGADAMRQILWGLFKKMVIADNFSVVTSSIFSNYQQLPGSSLAFGAVLYTIQIYADFSGYSDIAIGVAKLLGFRVTRNFDYPFFSQNIAEFWRKWHMSLTAWLTEYVFMPLNIAFRDWGKWGIGLAIVINFTIVGMWHGANWTYIVFGFVHGCAFLPLIIKGTFNKKPKFTKGRSIPTAGEFGNILITLTFVALAFIIFRSDTLTDAYHYFGRLFSLSIFEKPFLGDLAAAGIGLFFATVMIVVEWINRQKEHGLQIDTIPYSSLRLAIYFGLIIAIIFLSAGDANQFIYFKF